MRTLCLAILLSGCAAPTSPDVDDPATPDTGSGGAFDGVQPGAVMAPARAWLEASAPSPCTTPRDPLEAPFTRQVVGADWTPATPAPPARPEGGRGLVIADFDGDGVLDLLAPRVDEPSEWFRGVQDPSGFRFEPSGATLPPDTADSTGGSAADVDGDGDVDVVLERYTAPAMLLVNDGTGQFSARPLVPDLQALEGCAGSASWGDMDLDGDLDVFVGRTFAMDFGQIPPLVADTCPSVLLENVGGLDFVDRSADLPSDVQGTKIQASGWLDLDDDPFPELYTIADVPPGYPGNRLLDNVEGALVQDDTSSLNVRMGGMGLGIGDLNEDGQWDLVISGVAELKTLQSAPELGVWVDVSNAVGLVPDPTDGQQTAWGGEFADLDNDTDLDVVMAYGTANTLEPDELYVQREDGGFDRMGAAWAFDDEGNSRGTVTVDLDGNGALDIVKRTFGGPVTVDLAACTAGHWLVVKLHGPGQNTAAVGATVRVHLGDRVLMRPIEAGSTSYRSGGPAEAHFGLGDIDRVDRLEVEWPTGQVSTFFDVTADTRVQVHHVPPSERLGGMVR